MPPSKPHLRQSRPDSSAAWGVLALVAITLLVFARSWSNPLIYDDLLKIVENQDIRRLDLLSTTLIYPYDALASTWRNDPSRPLTYLIYALCYHWAASSPWLYHLVNTLLHAGCGVLIFRLGGKLLRPLWPQHATSASWCGALLFVLAPIHAGTVLYAYGLSDILAALFVLAALNVLLGPEPWKGWRLLLGAVFFVFALAAKQSAVVLPLLYILLLGWQTGGGMNALQRYGGRYGPLLAIAAAYLFARWSYFGQMGDLEAFDQAFPRRAYASVQGVVLGRYLLFNLLPMGLSVDHYVRPEDYSILARVAAWGGWTVAVGASLWVWARRGVGAWSFIAASILVFVVVLAPTSTVFPTVDCLVERRVYLANVGWYLLLGAGLASWLTRLKHHQPMANLILVAATGFVASLLLAGTLQRQRVYQSPVSVWQEALSAYPENIRARINLATALLDDHRCDEAAALLLPFLAQHPEHAPAHVKLAMAYQDKACPHPDQALAYGEYQKAIALAPRDVVAVFNAAVLMTEQERWAEAEVLYEQALRLQPKLLYAYQGLGEIALRQQQWLKAQEAFRAALRIDPSFQSALVQLESVQKAASLRPLP